MFGSQNMVHWKREWQTILILLPWESHEQYEKQKKNMTLKDEIPMSVGAQYTTGEEWRNSSRKNEEAEPSENNTQLWMWLVMKVKPYAVKSNVA